MEGRHALGQGDGRGFAQDNQLPRVKGVLLFRRYLLTPALISVGRGLLGSLLALGLCFSLWAQSTSVTIRRVKPTEAGAKDGSSWANAMSLTRALAASTSGDEVWVAAGTYKPHASTRTISFTVKAGVKVYGGFAGTETSKDERDAEANHPTILSGDIGTTGTHTDNSYHVATITGNNAELHDLTLTRGQATNTTPNSPERLGGGLYVGAHTGIVLSHCAFSQNTSDGSGGGLYTLASSSATLNHCIFRNNTSSVFSGGGAVFNGGATLNHCLFARNRSEASGGGVTFVGTATLRNCVFAHNSSVSGAGFDGGGGAYFGAGATVTNCTFYKNTAGNVGGGIRADAADFDLRNSLFFGNTAAGTSPNGPQVYVNNASRLRIDYCLIAGGSAGLRLPDGTSGIPTNAVSLGGASETDIFASVTAGDDTFLHLKLGSPAVDAGTDTYYANTEDLAGNTRDFGAAVDLGAYEFVLPDEDGNGLIEIGSLGELDYIRNNLSGKYELMKDLDFREGCGDEGTAASACDYPDWVPQDNDGNIVDDPADGTNAGFTPIPAEGSFEGTFEGNGYAIKNLYINLRAAEGVKVGLFGGASGATIQNVGLTGEHMFVSVITTSGDASVGSLSGTANDSMIRNCYATGDVTATTIGTGAEIRAGGLFGDADSGVTFSNCYATGDVTVRGLGTVYVGGLSGSSRGITIENCYATGDVKATGAYRIAGGLEGHSDRNNIRSSYHSGTLPLGSDDRKVPPAPPRRSLS